MLEGSTNNIIWYELLGLREGNVMIEARNPGDGAVSLVQLAVKAQAEKVQLPQFEASITTMPLTRRASVHATMLR